MIKFLKNWQGLWALISVIALFFTIPPVFEKLGMNSAILDSSYIHALVFTTIVYFSAIFCGWLTLQFDWKFMNTYVDNGHLNTDWKKIPALARVCISVGIVLWLSTLFVLCFAFLPKP